LGTSGPCAYAAGAVDLERRCRGVRFLLIMVTAVKICGITRAQDGLAAAHAGAHAIGLVFHPNSPRFVTVPAARAIAQAMPPFVVLVGLFVDADLHTIRSVLREVPLHLLQFHGDESPEFCAQVGMPYIKAVRMAPGVDLLQYAARYADAKGLLLDSFAPGIPGGTGTVFNWNAVPPNLTLPVVLAGGLTVANVAEAIRKVRPWAVDVSSGVEQEKGVKDPAKIAAFIRGARDADV
jgi:phosphoribosylanthranilate isomerase